MSKMQIDLGPVQETLLIPLLGRAVVSRNQPALFEDKAAVKIVDELDYDFNKWKRSAALSGSVIRTKMYDQEVARFLDLYPTGTIVEIGCGLNTRFERLDNGQANWVELDLPDSMALRKNYFSDQPRRQMIAASVLDTDWFDTVEKIGGPYCFISEAVIIYLENDKAKQAITQIVSHFGSKDVSWFITDTMDEAMVNDQKNHDAMRHLSRDSWYRWHCVHPKELEDWGVGLKLERSQSFMDMNPDLYKIVPLKWRFFLKWLPGLIRKKVQAYRINTFSIHASS